MAAPFVLDANLRIQAIEGLDALKAELAGITKDLKLGVGAPAGGGSKGPAAAINWKSVESLGAVALTTSQSLAALEAASKSLVLALEKAAAGFGKGGFMAKTPVAAPPAAGTGTPLDKLMASAAKLGVGGPDPSKLLSQLSQAANKLAVTNQKITEQFAEAVTKLNMTVPPGAKPAPLPGFNEGQAGFNYRMQSVLSAQRAMDAESRMDVTPYTGGYVVSRALRGQRRAAQMDFDFQNRMAAVSASQREPSFALDAGAPVAKATGPSWRDQIAEWKNAHTSLEQVKRSAESTGQAIERGMTKGTRAAGDFAGQIWLAAKRYTAFLAATTIGFGAFRAFSAGAASVVEFDKQMIRLDQTIDPTREDLAATRQEIINLSTSTGTAASELAKASVTLGQAGYKGDKLREILSEVANVPLLPSFDSIEQATTSVIAILGQFGDQAGSVRSILDKLNQVSNDYAITSAELGEAVKRGGGTWKALGGSLDEYLALVTAAKQTTQESAEAIGTGLRTISAKMMQPKTLEFLEGIGVETRNTEGQLLGMFEILKQTAAIYKTAPENQRRDIGEAFGGLRQMGRTLAVLENFDLVLKALNTSLTSNGSVQQDVAKGTESLAKQVDILKAKMTELVQTLAPDVFVPFVQFLTKAGSLSIGLATSLSPVLKYLLEIGAAAGALYGVRGIAYIAARAYGGIGGKGPALMPAGLEASQYAAAGVGAVGHITREPLMARVRGGLASGAADIASVLPWWLAGRGATAAQAPAQTGQMAQGYFWPWAKTIAPGQGTAPTFGEQGQFDFEGAAQPRGRFFDRAGVQFAAITALHLLGPKLTEFALTTAGASEKMAEFAGSIVRVATALVAVMAVLQREKVSSILGQGLGLTGFLGLGGKGTGGMLLRGLGIAAGGAGLLSIGATAYKGYADAEFDKKIDEFRQAIKDIKVPKPGDDAGVIAAEREFVAEIGKGIRTARDRFGAAFSGSLNRIGMFWQGLFSLDLNKMGASFNPNLPNQEIEKNIDDLIGQNLSLLNAMLTNAIRRGGYGFQNVFVEDLEKAFSELGFAMPRALSTRIMEKVVGKAGGLQGVSQMAKNVADDLKNSGLAEQAKHAAQNLAAVVVPPQLFGQLATLGKAVEAVTRKMDASVGSFENQYATVANEGITAIRPPTGMEAGAVAQAMGLGGLKGLPGVSPEMEIATGVAEYIQATARAFVKQLSESSATQKRFGGEDPFTGKGLTNSINDFLKNRNVPTELGIQLKQMLRSIGEELEKAANIDASINEDKINELVKKHMAPYISTSDGIAKLYAELIGGVLRKATARGEAEAQQLSAQLAVPRTPQGLMSETTRALGAVGIKATGTMPTELVGQRAQIMKQLETAGSRITAGVGEAEKRLREFTLGMGRPGDTFVGLLADLEKWRTQSSKLQYAEQLLEKAVSESADVQNLLNDRQRRAAQVFFEMTNKQQETEEILRRGREESTGANEPTREALRRQANELNALMALQANVVRAAETAMKHPEEPKYDIELSRAQAQYQAQAAQFWQDRINLMGLGNMSQEYDPRAVADLSDSQRDKLQKLNESLNAAVTAQADVRSRETEEGRRRFQQEMAAYNLRRREQIRGISGIDNDPLGAKTFKGAVDKFEGVIGVLAKSSGGAANVTRAGYAVRSLMTEGDATAIERSLFGGKTRQEMVDYANMYLRGGMVGGVDATDLAGLKQLPWDQQQDQIKTLVTTITEKLNAQGFGDKNLDDRLRMLFGNPRIGLENFRLDERIRERATNYGADLRVEPPEPTPEEIGAKLRQQSLLRPQQPDLSPQTQPAGGMTPVSSFRPVANFPRPMGQMEFAPISSQQMGKGTTTETTDAMSALFKQIDSLADVVEDMLTRLEDLGGEPQSGETAAAQAKGEKGESKDDRLKAVREGQEVLADRLRETADAIREGVAMKVESAQRVNVSVEGLDRAIESELKPEIENAARNAAKEIVRRVLVDLAGSSDAEGARLFNAAARNLT